MTNQQHLITPPPDLIEVWVSMLEYHPDEKICSLAAQWGADQELEACCEWFQEFYETESWVKRDLKEFRAARRPEPPSLKEQALRVLASAPGPDYPNVMTVLNADEHALIRQALEALSDD